MAEVISVNPIFPAETACPSRQPVGGCHVEQSHWQEGGICQACHPHDVVKRAHTIVRSGWGLPVPFSSDDRMTKLNRPSSYRVFECPAGGGRKSNFSETRVSENRFGRKYDPGLLEIDMLWCRLPGITITLISVSFLKEKEWYNAEVFLVNASLVSQPAKTSEVLVQTRFHLVLSTL